MKQRTRGEAPSPAGPPGRLWRVRDVLDFAGPFLDRRGSPTGRLDAEVLLAHVLATDRLRLYLDPQRPLDLDERRRYREALTRRARGEPVAYIVGHREFWSLDFEVGPAVLIPRPDSETLVSAALDLLDHSSPTPAGPLRIVDVGTGSGCLGIAVTHELAGRPVAASSTLELVGTDRSARALAVARRNARRHLAPLAAGRPIRWHFLQTDLLAGLRPEPLAAIILANLPYVAEGERSRLARDVVDFEPHEALFAGPRGLDAYERLFEQAPAHLAPEGALIIEIDPRQRAAAIAAAEARDWRVRAVLQDYAQRDRAILLDRAAS